MRNRGGEFGMNLPRTEPGDIPFEVLIRYSQFSQFSTHFQRIGTKLRVKTANYFRDGRVVVESVGVGRFKVSHANFQDFKLFF